MAYTVPSISGVPVIRYMSNSTGNEYTAGKTLPAVYRADEMLLCERIDGSGKFGPGYGYSASLGGWIYYGSKYYSDSAILSTLNGKPVTHIYQSYQPGADIVLGSKGAFEYSNINGYLTQFAPTIPATVKYINRMFYGQNQLSGIIKIDANPTSYTDWLTGTTQPIKLTGKSTMLSELAAAYGNVSVYYPHAISVLAQRTNATTQELDDEGTNAKITVTLSGDPDNTTYTIEVRRDGGTVAMLEGVTVSGTAPEMFTVFDDETALATDVSYTYEVVVTDSWGTVRTTTDTLTTAFYTMDIGNQGHEIAFGGSAKEDPEDIPRNGKFNCFMDADFKGETYFNGNPINDFIVEQDYLNVGPSGAGKGYYQKWASGIAKLDYTYPSLGVTTKVWTAPIYYGDYTSWSNCFNDVHNGLFIEPPDFVNCDSNNSQFINIIPMSWNENGVTGVRFLSVGAKTNAACRIHIRAVGKWK